jgi:hypothetical protein
MLGLNKNDSGQTRHTPSQNHFPVRNHLQLASN